MELKKSSLALLSALSFQALSAPIDIHDTPVEAMLGELEEGDSSFISRNYTLFADSVYDDFVWFIAKKGYLSYRSSNGYSSPDIGVMKYLPRGSASHFNPKQEVISIGGAFNGAGFPKDLERLESILKEQGFTMSAAPVYGAKGTATAYLNAKALEFDESGNLKVLCEEGPLSQNPDSHTFDKDGNQAQGTSCFIFLKDENLSEDQRKISTDIFRKATVRVPDGHGESSGRIPFSFLTYPNANATNSIVKTFQDGDNINDLFGVAVNVTWDVGSKRTIKKAQIKIDWSEIFKQSSAFSAHHNNKCLDIQVNEFFRDQVENGVIEVSTYNPNTEKYEREFAVNEKRFKKLLQSIEEELKNELFVEIREFKASKLGQVDNTSYSEFYILRKNIERQISNAKEKRTVFWSTDEDSTTQIQTSMELNCIEGGFGQPLTWRYSDASCVFDKIPESYKQRKAKPVNTHTPRHPNQDQYPNPNQIQYPNRNQVQYPYPSQVQYPYPNQVQYPTYNPYLYQGYQNRYQPQNVYPQSPSTGFAKPSEQMHQANQPKPYMDLPDNSGKSSS